MQFQSWEQYKDAVTTMPYFGFQNLAGNCFQVIKDT